jgi:hypothetical protein
LIKSYTEKTIAKRSGPAPAEGEARDRNIVLVSVLDTRDDIQALPGNAPSSTATGRQRPHASKRDQEHCCAKGEPDNLSHCTSSQNGVSVEAR